MCGGAAYALPKCYSLACDLTMKRSQDELIRMLGVEYIETGPVDGIRGEWKRVKTMPKQ